MTTKTMRAAAIWAVLIAVAGIALGLSAGSPLLAWRDPVYIAAGFSGVLALALLVFQPLLAAGLLPGLSAYRGRRVHRWIGAVIILAVLFHVVALWVTSPPDVVDVLLFRSPAPFSPWGAVAMWAVLAAGLLAVFRTKLPLRPRTWRKIHTSAAVVAIIGTAGHALLIEGTMETISKTILCVLALLATLKALLDLRVWSQRAQTEGSASSSGES